MGYFSCISGCGCTIEYSSGGKRGSSGLHGGGRGGGRGRIVVNVVVKRILTVVTVPHILNLIT